MFSFIKAIQNLLANLKKKKGLWFLILFFLSVSGIFLSFFLISNMTKTASKHVYENIALSYKSNLESAFSEKQKDFRNIVLALKSNDNFMTNLNNQIISEGIVKKYNDNLANNGFAGISIKFTSTTNQINQFRNSVNAVINRKNTLFGIEIFLNGPHIVYIEPFFIGENLVGVIEINQSLLSFKSDYEKNKGGLFLFLIEERIMNALSTDIKNADYRLIVDNLYVEEKRYDGQFFANVIEEGSEGMKYLKEHGYRANENYFKISKEIFDVNGAFTGYLIVGENVEGSNTFVNIVDKLTKEVTMIALGLVMSILIFMF